MESKELTGILENRVLVLDGAMGTMIQRLGLQEKDFRTDSLMNHPQKLYGCNDILSLSKPEAIKGIHDAYLKAGADIISTNTFNANAISMADYGLNREPGLIREINRSAAVLARRAAEEAPERAWGGKALVAGSIGPTNRTASMSPEVSDPALRNITYDELFAAYTEQIEGLIEGGVDLLLFENVFDTLNLKAGLDAANQTMKKLGHQLPVMVSATVSDKAGRTLSGQTLSAFAATIENYENIFSIGLNCGFGAEDMIPYVRELGKTTGHYISAHPNAGLPNALGEYNETPQHFGEEVGKMIKEGLVNIAGGCCGTTPDHIREIVAQIGDAVPHKTTQLTPALRISGLEMVEVLPDNNFLNVGERCNVAGSRKFLRLIKEKKYEEAMSIAARQVEDGAMVIDVNMDDALLNAEEEMVHFLRYVASDPDIAKVPVMIDSSDWNVVESGLKNLQGKGIVNSISLKEGEEAFIKKAIRIRELGAAVIVMAFDEIGQADTFERKIEVSSRAYRLLTEKCGFSPDDIIFDVNIMAVATGMKEHNRYGIDFIKGVEWIKKNLPGARTSGGVSNLSFAFRGKNRLRESMHAVFLYHAIAAGLDMGIVNPATSVTYEDIEPDLRSLIEDVVLARREGASEELVEYASSEIAGTAKKEEETKRDVSIPVEDRLKKAIVKGNAEFLADDLEEALEKYDSAVKIIEGPLMDGMNHVGALFGEGKMFLPQVVKTARTMKAAVDYLRPVMEKDKAGKKEATAGKVVFATVKGDVHDIGKNIVSIVLSCNNFEVIDLGVMVPTEKIIETVKNEKPDFLCLSGLITPSLSEMVNVAKSLEKEGIRIPIMVGGATTSRLHTALKIAPEYSGVVVHASDAAQNPLIAARLRNPATKDEFISDLRKEYEELTRNSSLRKTELIPLEEARSKAVKLTEVASPKPDSVLGETIIEKIPLKEIVPFINWKMLFHAWRLTGSYLNKFPYDGCESCERIWRQSLSGDEKDKAEEALKLYRDAKTLIQSMLEEDNFDGKASVIFYHASGEGDDLIISPSEAGEDRIRIPMLRRQTAGEEPLCLTDMIAEEDYVGIFMVTAGKFLAEEAEKLKSEGDSYGALLRQSLADRLAEAAAEWWHAQVRHNYWGYAENESLTREDILKGKYPGIRPAVGYPMIPDQLINLLLSPLLPLSELGVEMTENGAMLPSATISGFFIASPESKYFMTGEIGQDQLKDYSRRRGIDEERMKEILRM
ncbi:MAG: methionine synthase [Muribaculaceae bacterium]|nr:methionine synthase [Muribaculaceae bacterium]